MFVLRVTGKTYTSKGQTVRTETEDEIKSGLIGNAQEREDAFTMAYARYAKPLAAFIRESVAPTLDSDEVATAVSKTFCALAKYIAQGKFRSVGALSTLLFSIARRKGYDQLRIKTSLKRRHDADTGFDGEEINDGGMCDEDFAVRVTQRLVMAPKIRELWRTAADSCEANEIIRQFRLWISTLPRVQRKVAQVILKHMGDISDPEICDEIATNDERPTVASVKSARKQISQKFASLIQKNERN
jgi:DNA-directed RNA polymerase specialized sigma24 family protein